YSIIIEAEQRRREAEEYVKARQGQFREKGIDSRGIVFQGPVVEGHVPAQDVKRLLETTPQVRGLSVPDMPIGSPGMERGDRVEPYAVTSFTAEGDTSVFARYGQQ
ncbi:MAG: DUF411 domain-containing protein, partial [Salinibacter sp.]